MNRIGNIIIYIHLLLFSTTTAYPQERNSKAIIKSTIQSLTKTLTLNQEKLGPEHPYIATIYSELANAHFKKENYDVILMDVQMPEMNGFEATKKIREIEKSAGKEKAIPIMATGTASGVI